MFLILISHMFAFFKRLISAKPQCSGGGGGGGGSLFFSACVGSRPAPNTFTSKNITNFKHPKNILPEPTYIYKYQTPIPPTPPGRCSRCPSESDKTGVMKIATKERDIDNDVIVYIVIGDAYQIFRQTLSIKQS